MENTGVTEDIELERLLREEDHRYLNCIDLIAASNAPPASVRDNSSWGVAQFRSAEGHVGRRPYAGQERFDAIELLTAQRACEVFGAEHANVQPLSGTMANLAAYRAVMKPGDTLLTMTMHCGGHLSHGHPLHQATRTYNIQHYSVDPETYLINYDDVHAIARRIQPRAIVAGYSSYPRSVDFTRFAEIADSVGAVLIADISHIAGLVAAGLVENPCVLGAIVTTSVEKTLCGTRGGIVLCPGALADRVDKAIFPGLQSSVGLASITSLCFVLQEAKGEQFRRYQKQVVANAKLLAAILSQSSIPLLTGGTDTHLLLLDVGKLSLTGQEAEKRLEDIGILSNRNILPFDSRTAFIASGLRLGTPTITARGFKEGDIRALGEIIVAALIAADWPGTMARKLREDALALARRPRPDDNLADLCGKISNITGKYRHE